MASVNMMFTIDFAELEAAFARMSLSLRDFAVVCNSVVTSQMWNQSVWSNAHILRTPLDVNFTSMLDTLRVWRGLVLEEFGLYLEKVAWEREPMFDGAVLLLVICDQDLTVPSASDPVLEDSTFWQIRVNLSSKLLLERSSPLGRFTTDTLEAIWEEIAIELYTHFPPEDDDDE